MAEQTTWVEKLVAAVQADPALAAVAVQVGPYLLSNRELLLAWGQDGIAAIVAAMRRGGHAGALAEIAAQMDLDQLTAGIAANSEALAALRKQADARVDFLNGLALKVGMALLPVILAL